MNKKDSVMSRLRFSRNSKASSENGGHRLTDHANKNIDVVEVDGEEVPHILKILVI